MWPPSRGVIVAALALVALAAGAGSAALYTGWNGAGWNGAPPDDGFAAIEMVTIRFPDGWQDEPVRRPEALLTLPRPAPPPPPPGPTRPLTQMSAADFGAALEAVRRLRNPPNALFNDAQISSLKSRLRLTAAQEKRWPPMEEALRRLMWLEKDGRKTPELDPESLQQLKTAAAGFVAVLTESQKRDIRALAHVGGLKLGL